MLKTVSGLVGLWCLTVLAGCAPGAPGGGDLPEGWLDADALWQLWEQERIVPTAAACLRHEELVERLESLHRQFPESSRLEPVGSSYEGRTIHLLSLGTGPTEVMLWSQMHGDEPSATPALLDVAHYLLSHAQEPLPAAILEGLTLRMVPMLNPDGSERYQRRNAQAIDINRDALDLATPEGRLLRELRGRFEPLLGFNLHDQNRRTGVGDTRALATAAVLAVSGDEANTLTPGRGRAMRACSAIVESLEPHLPGGVARYDEDWSPRAFGDNLTAWGTPVVLIESGGIPVGADASVLVRLNFVALLRVLSELVRDDLESFDPATYRDLPRNRSGGWVDVAVRGGRVLQGVGEPYRADLAFNVDRPERVLDGAGECSIESEVSGSSISEIGDTRFLGAARIVDAADALVVPSFEVAIDGWGSGASLDQDRIERLARWGVSTVRWQVAEDRYFEARALARRLGGPGRPGVIVTTDGVGAAPVVDLDAVSADPPARYADRVSRLFGSAGDATVAEPSLVERAASLWADRPWPPLSPGATASFLLLEGPDVEAATVGAVWLDGVEVD